MIKIKKGVMINRYATLYGVDVEEVVDWVNSYINHPELYPETEKTEQERADSIRAYIERQVKNSVTERMKCSMNAARLAA